MIVITFCSRTEEQDAGYEAIPIVFVDSRTVSCKPIIFKYMLGFASTKSHASGKIRHHYFRILRTGSDVFFDADSESPLVKPA